MPKTPGTPKTTPSQKILLILFGIIAALACLETAMRLGDFILALPGPAGSGAAGEKASSYRILTLGESTTAGRRSWPYFLEQLLNKEPRRTRFAVFNGAVGGTTTPFILSRLRRQLDRYRPHLVIAMMGHNDTRGFSWAPELRRRIPSFLSGLRILRFARWVAAGWSNRDRLAAAERSPPGPSDKLYAPAERACNIDGDPDAADRAFERLFREHPVADVARTWGRCLSDHERFESAKEKYALALRLSPGDRKTLLEAGTFYCARGNLAKGEKHLRKAIAMDPDDVSSYRLLAECYYSNGVDKEEIERFLKRNLLYLRVDYKAEPSEITAVHYRKLHSILTRRGIKLIAMQYPTQNVESLKSYFPTKTDIVFAGNEDNFFRALNGGKYEDYFIDRIATTFGHATDAGNRLIAASAAGAVLKIISPERGNAATVRSGNRDGAGERMGILRRLSRQTPRNMGVWIDLAAVAARLKKRAIALDSLSHAEKLTPRPKDLGRMARIYEDLGEPRRAMETIEYMVRLSSNSAAARLDLAAAAARLKDHRIASDSLAQAEKLQMRPEDMTRAARLYEKLGEPRRAMRLLSRLNKLPPGDVGAWIGLAAAAARLNERETALESLAQAEKQELRPPDLKRAARIYRDLKEFRGAERALKRLLQLTPADGEAWLDLASVASRLKEREIVLDSLSRAETRTLPLKDLGRAARIHDSVGGHADAVRLLSRLVKRAPGDTDAWIDLARYQRLAGDIGSAKRSLARAGSRNPTFKQLRKIALLHQAWKEYGSAIKLFGQLINKDARASLYRDRGICEYQRGSVENAIKDLREAIKRAPGLSSAHLSLAAIYINQGRKKEALKVFNAALAAPPRKDMGVFRNLIMQDRKRLLSP